MSAAVSQGMDEPAGEHDTRPIIPVAGQSNWGAWAFVTLLLLGGAVLFSLLNANRAEQSAPRTLAPESDPSRRISSPPPLALPQDFSQAPPALRPATLPEQTRVVPEPRRVSYQSIPLRNYAPPPPVPDYAPPPFVPDPAPPELVFDTRSAPRNTTAENSASSVSRVTARRFANPSLTIPQGTVIPAVLETALDSTRPGGVRALVQRDIHAFDGSRVLVNRGSRLYGEYEASLERGQKRALIRWTRLIRPDGVTIALDSPASDPLGRAGVKGKVDSKFFQRFGGAILQSVLDIGVGVATREATDGVIVALPGSTQNVSQVSDPTQITPTLKIKHGTSVSIFVARDLDFSTVER